MREDIIVEQATAKEITHEDVEMVRRFGAEFRRADESYVSALSLMAPVFELPLSDVTVVDGEKAVLECRVAATPAAEVTWYVGANRREDSCSDIFVSFRHRTFSESKPLTFTSLMSCRHACNVQNTWTCVNSAECLYLYY